MRRPPIARPTWGPRLAIDRRANVLVIGRANQIVDSQSVAVMAAKPPVA